MTTHLCRRSSFVFVVVAGLLVATVPARAATGRLEWRDTANDAGGPVAYQVGDTALPAPASQPRLDIRRSAMASNGSTLVWTARFASLSNKGVGMQRATLGTGVWYAFEFAYGSGHFFFHLTLDPVAGRSFFMGQWSEGGARWTSCAHCGMTADPATNTVTLRAPISSVGSGVGQPLGPGDTLRDVAALAGYATGAPPPVGSPGWFSASDIAVPGGDDNFTL